MYKPLAIIGAGFAGGFDLEIPLITTWGGLDKFPHDHPMNFGTFGVAGGSGNKILLAATHVINMGASLNQMQVPANTKLNLVNSVHGPVDDEWIAECQRIKSEWKTPETKWDVCPYKFFEELNKHTRENDIVVTDAGANLTWTFQNLKIKKGMRVFTAFNHSPMGYSLPAAIGAHFAAPEKRIICIVGDGGLLMCLQELATVARHNIPIKIFLMNNDSHGIQIQTAETWLSGRKHGMDYESGLFFPDYERLLASFGVAYDEIKKNEDLFHAGNILQAQCSVFMNIIIDSDARITPFLKASQKLEDL